MNYSLTQGGNLAALAGVVVLLLQALKIDIAPAEVETFIGAAAALVGLGTSWYGRWRKGDITVGGFKK